MDKTNAQMLDEAYRKTLEEVAQATAGSDEAKWELQKLHALHTLKMNEQKAANESYLASIQGEEISLKEAQMKDGRKDRILQTVLNSAAILIPVAVSSYWMAKGLKFEQTGTFTSRTGQWLSNHIRLFRK